MRSAHDLDIMFDDCIERLAQGESLESCLQRYRAQADALRDLLSTAQTLSSMAAAPPPSPTLMGLDKQKFLRAAAQFTPPPTVAPTTPPQTGLFAWLRSPHPIGRPAIVGVTLLTVFALFVAITALSISALPGDLFYPPKVAAETIDMNVKKALNPDQAAEYQAAFDHNRAADVQKAMDLGRQALVTLNGYVAYVDEQSLSLSTGIRVALRSDLLAGRREDLRQGTYLTVVGHIGPDSPFVLADRIDVAEPEAGDNFRASTRPAATFTATRRPTRRPVFVPPTRRPTARPTRRPQPTATRIPLPAMTATRTATATWTSTATTDVTATPSSTAVAVTPSATPTMSEVTPTTTAVDLTPTPDESTPTASPTPDEPTPTPTVTDVAASTPTPTDEPPTATPEPPTATPELPTATPEPPTATPEPPTATPELPTATLEPPPTSSPAAQIVPAWTTKSKPGTHPRSTRPATVFGFYQRFRS